MFNSFSEPNLKNYNDGGVVCGAQLNTGIVL